MPCRCQAITWIHVDLDVLLHMVSLGHKELLFLGGCCDAGYPFKTQLKLKSCEMSFLQNIYFKCQTVLKIWYCRALCKFSKWFDNWAITYGHIIFHEIWVSDVFRTVPVSYIVATPWSCQVNGLNFLLHNSVHNGFGQQEWDSLSQLWFPKSNFNEFVDNTLISL